MSRGCKAAILPDGRVRYLPLGGGATAKFNPDEPRDRRGRWTTEGGLLAPEVARSPEGFSVSLAGDAPVAGFMVALGGRHTHVYPAGDLRSEAKLAADIDAMLRAERETFARPGMYLGGWVNGGKLWLEPSENIASREDAVRAGQERDQIAIWDVERGEEIGTGGTGSVAAAAATPKVITSVPEGYADLPESQRKAEARRIARDLRAVLAPGRD